MLPFVFCMSKIEFDDFNGRLPEISECSLKTVPVQVDYVKIFLKLYPRFLSTSAYINLYYSKFKQYHSAFAGLSVFYILFKYVLLYIISRLHQYSVRNTQRQ